MADLASDNTAPVHPAVLEALRRANEGRAPAYGADALTARAEGRVRALLGQDVPVFLVWNGTGANVTGLAALLRSRDAVLCAEDAHINVDECGAPERFTGAKLVDIPTADGKLRPEDLAPRLTGLGVEHHVQPAVVSITQSTERGTVYTPDELRALGAWCHRHGLALHMDGARIANATAALGGDLRATTRDLGVDVLSFGFTKNGAMGVEAVAFLDPARAEGFRFVRKQAMQLASKMRYLAAQVDALLADGLWLELAAHANRMARRLADGAAGVPGVRLSHPVTANGVFATLPDRVIESLQRRHAFYVWKAGTDGTSEVRWMCSWATAPEEVDTFVRDLAEAMR